MVVAIPCEDNDKSVVCSIWPDEEMPYVTMDAYRDEYGVVHPRGEKERVDLITSSIAVVNRTIPMALMEPSITYATHSLRKHMKTLDNIDDQKDIMFEIMDIFNPDQTRDLRNLYETLSDRDKRKFIESSINDGIYIRWEAFSEEKNIRDAMVKIHTDYSHIVKPCNIFRPKPKWGRDIYIGQDYIGFQYILLLKQSGEKGFSVRSAGAISEESLPERSYENKIGRSPHSETPIRFGEYESPPTGHTSLIAGISYRSTLLNHSSDIMVA